MRHLESMASSDAVALMRARLTERAMSEKVQKAWLYWARSILNRFSDRAPAALTVSEVGQFMADLSEQRQITDAGRRQALQAIHFLLTDVVGVDDQGLDELLESTRVRQGPVILSPAEVQQVLDELRGSQWLMASLVYGAGLRLMECVRLRIRDLKDDRIVVCDINGRPSRETLLPERVREPMRAHLEALKMQHIRELADGFGTASLPPGFRTGSATARAWIWQFVFPGPYMKEPGRGNDGCKRNHVPEPEARQAIEQAARQAGIDKPVSADTLRNSFAAHLIRRGVAVVDVEKLLGIEKSADASRHHQTEAVSRPVGSSRSAESVAVGF